MSRRGAVLPAVLVFIAAMALSASALVVRAGSRSVSGDAWLARAQARMAAVSGIEAAAAELNNQRADLLAGEDPDLTRDWVLATNGGREWIVRLLSIDGAEPWSAESARIDVRTASAETLRSIGLEPTTEPESSSALALAVQSDSVVSYEQLTSYARDPEIQAGVGGSLALAGAGTPRYDITSGVPDELIEEVRERFDQTFAERFAIRARREGFSSRSSLVRWLGSSGLGYRRWDEVLDLIAFTGEPSTRGRLDVARADAAILEAVLGVSDGNALVEDRQNLRDDQRAGTVWLLENGHLDLEQYASLCEGLTFRSLQWRVLIEAGRRDEINAASVGETDEFGVLLDDALDDGGLEYRIAYEAIIDVAGESPEIVWIREITLAGFEVDPSDDVLTEDEFSEEPEPIDDFFSDGFPESEGQP